MEFKDRIELLMKTQHMNRQVFGQLTGMSQSTLSNIFNGKTQPTLKIVFDIKDKMPSVNTDWLLFGVGRMFNDRQDDAEVGGVQEERVMDERPVGEPLRRGDEIVQDPHGTHAQEVDGLGEYSLERKRVFALLEAHGREEQAGADPREWQERSERAKRRRFDGVRREKEAQQEVKEPPQTESGLEELPT